MTVRVSGIPEALRAERRWIASDIALRTRGVQ